jgi:SWI/SNF-related matrix-associated actin-dependent regulator of chromatin subfamily A3
MAWHACSTSTLRISSSGADEIKKFAPGLRVYTYHASAKPAAVRNINSADVILTTPGSVRMNNPFANAHRVIYDESHLLGTSHYPEVGAGNSRFVWLLTGTPMSSSTQDLSCAFRVLGKPPALTTLQTPGGSYYRLDVPRDDRLVAALKPLMIRHTKDQRIGGEVALALPEKDVSTVWLTPSATEQQLYGMACAFDTKKLRQLRGNACKAVYLDQATRFMRSACGNFYPERRRGRGAGFDNAERSLAYKSGDHRDPLVDQCTKVKALRDDLIALRRQDANMHAVIFTHAVGTHETIVAMLRASQFSVYEFTGATAAKKRHDYIRAFQDSGRAGTGGAQVFVVTVKTGSVGITLTAATRVYLMEPAIDPAAEAQMAGRIHRLGQTKDVLIKRFAFRQSIEATLCEMHDEIRAGRVVIADGTLPASAVKKFTAHAVEKAVRKQRPRALAYRPVQQVQRRRYDDSDYDSDDDGGDCVVM